MVESKPARVAKVSIARLLGGPAVCQNSPREQIQVPLGRHDHPPWMSISQNALSPLVCSHCSRTCGEFDMRYPMDKYHFPSHRQADSLTSGTFLPVTQPSCMCHLHKSSPLTTRQTYKYYSVSPNPPSYTISSIPQEAPLQFLALVQTTDGRKN